MPKKTYTRQTITATIPIALRTHTKTQIKERERERAKEVICKKKMSHKVIREALDKYEEKTKRNEREIHIGELRHYSAVWLLLLL